MNHPSTDIRTSQGYMIRFWQLVSESSDASAPMRLAFISIESELYHFHGLRRYSSYRSFSTVKRRKPTTAKCRSVQL